KGRGRPAPHSPCPLFFFCHAASSRASSSAARTVSGLNPLPRPRPARERGKAGRCCPLRDGGTIGGMSEGPDELLRVRDCPALHDATLVLAFTGWMDGGDVSTGTVRRLVDLLGAPPVAEIDPDPFYLFNFPGPMEVAALFRPALRIAEGLIASLEMPANTFHAHEPAHLLLFLGREPNLRWPTFADCVLQFARRAGAGRMLFAGSFGGSVPHTREPRLHVTCSDRALLPEMARYGLRRTGYAGPGSFASYLMTRAPAAGLEMVSLAA